MNVIACDVCKKTNVENSKPFARVRNHPYYDHNTGKKLRDENNIGLINLMPLLNLNGALDPNEKLLCNVCTMAYITEQVKLMFSVENMTKLTQSA